MASGFDQVRGSASRRLSHVGFGKVEVGVRKEGNQPFAAKQQTVHHCHLVTGLQQLRRQQRPDVARSACYNNVFWFSHVRPPDLPESLLVPPPPVWGHWAHPQL
jgi:hypothetical protein